MNQQPSAMRAAVVAAVLAWVALGMPNPLSRAPSPTPGPQPVDVLDLGAAFDSATDRDRAKHDAHLLGHATNWLADYLEADGARPDPKYVSGGQVEDLRVELCWWITEGKMFGAQYPALGPAIGGHLEAIVGPESTDLTPDTRAAWVRAFREISHAAIKAVR